MTPLVDAPAPLQLRAGARTDTGRRRAVNEDSLLAEFPVYIVADGMGGHEAGDRASVAVVEAFRPLLGRRDLAPDAVTQAVADAHARVAQIAKGTRHGAGSTLCGVVAVEQDGQRWWLAVNIGDSRLYRLLGTQLEQITVDHSVAQELVDQGRLTREGMATYEGRNVITRAVGDAASEADYWLLPVVTGERLLVCSDGLTGELPDEAIRAGLTLGGPTEQTALALVEQAVDRGGRDNVSAIVIDVVAGGVTPASDDATGAFAMTTGTAIASGYLDETTVPSYRRSARA